MALTALKVIGPFKGPTGYEHHVREFVRELDRQGVAIELVDFPAWGPAKLPRRLRDPWFETLTKPSRARVLLHFCLPPQIILDKTRANVNYTMFEATRLPPTWVEHNRKCDLIILPTESSKRAWINSGMPAQHMRLCPLGINPRLFRTTVPALDLYGANGELLNQYRVRFLNVSELRPRKNLLGLLRAWIKATSPQDDAVLIIKLGCYEPGALELFRDKLNALEQNIGKTLDQAAPVHFLYEIFPDADMPRLYAAATHYISLSLGEGWDQPMVEAAASDLKLMAPNHSAYPTYLDTTVAHLISSREVPLVFKDDSASGTHLHYAHWWEPDEDEAIHCIRLAIEGGDWGKASARSRILEQFTWEKVTHRLIDILSEVEARGVAVIKVGAATEIEMKEKKARVEDALHATRAAVEEGIVPGGGVALIRALDDLGSLKGANHDQDMGIQIAKRAMEEPLRQIVGNSGEEPSVVLNKIKESKGNFGWNAATSKYGDMVEMGILDPTKVTRMALQNAASIAGLMITTEAMVSEMPKEEEKMMPGGRPGMGDMDMM